MRRRAFLAGAPVPLLAQPQVRKKILLRTGWQMRNIGDVCFTPAMLGALERFIPEADVTCWASNIDEAGRKLIRRDFPGGEVSRWPDQRAGKTDASRPSGGV